MTQPRRQAKHGAVTWLHLRTENRRNRFFLNHLPAPDSKNCRLASRLVDGEPIPEPSPVRRGQYLIAPEETLSLKIALNQAIAERKMSAADLARRLGCDHKEARRLLDPHEPTKAPRLVEALAGVGYGVRMTVYDATRNERLLSAPVARTPHREKWGKTLRVKKTDAA
jgi:hypothetical protein